MFNTYGSALHPVKERFSSPEEKEQWIKSNPDEYKKLNSESNNPNSERFVNEEAKIQWIKENPSQYQSELNSSNNSKSSELVSGTRKTVLSVEEQRKMSLNAIEKLRIEIKNNKGNKDYDHKSMNAKLDNAIQIYNTKYATK